MLFHQSLLTDPVLTSIHRLCSTSSPLLLIPRKETLQENMFPPLFILLSLYPTSFLLQNFVKNVHPLDSYKKHDS